MPRGYEGPVPLQLTVYLRNHEAAARAGQDLYRRTVSNHRRKPYVDELRDLATEARADLGALRQLMRQLGVSPDRLLGVTLQLGERVGRLKPNGHVLRRAPLSDLVEIEGLLDATHVKAAGWSALAAAKVDTGQPGLDLEALRQRAEDQLQRLRVIHRTVAADALPKS